jgi:pilus assembly protein CpaD
LIWENTIMRMRIVGLTLIAPLLLAGCLSAHQPLGLPDSSTLTYDGKRVVPPDCDALNAPSTLLDAGEQRPSVAFGCATYTNLGAMIANPSDLVAPPALGTSDSTKGAAAARRYYDGKVTPLNDSTISQ